MITFFGVLPAVYRRHFALEYGGYIGIFFTFQAVSVSIFATFSFLIQMRREQKIINLVNLFFRLHDRVVEKTHSVNMFREKFIFLLCLKFTATIIGFTGEIPSLIHVEPYLQILFYITSTFGVYMWLSSMFVLDVCFLGFLVISSMYEEMGVYLKTMLHKMKYIETKDKFGISISHYHCMKLLCESADNIDISGAIYHDLYEITNHFNRIFHWQILYYIYYNFMVILLLLHGCIYMYLSTDFINFMDLAMVLTKFTNLALLIMCADNIVQKSEIPNLLALDIVCSDIDERWDKSVETFINQRKTENLEIKILGFFQLQNEFILVILSAIISYMFILVQFGLSDAKNQTDSVVKNEFVQTH
ncbi:gustatory receptor for bitter taste 93a-like [Teleopsis dalmanni]|uniref:gustatory receptor for bitter taste 93a-like n=1 Tax=Teleopsis dalmanni TaxID=139649 RepID=UPI0018CF80CA|nr:gustatory receptor for bitter taste 93a-like [Teleopsis dalmanni]